MKGKKLPVPVLAALLAVSLAACGRDAGSSEGDTDAGETDTVSSTDYFTKRDLRQTYDGRDAVHVTLSDNVASADAGKGALIEGNTVTLTSAGVYVFSGTLSDGQIEVDAGDDDKVEIVLDGVTMKNSDSACIYVKNADKVFITTAKGSENVLSTAGTFEADGDTEVDGVIFSKDDLVLKGTGSLTVSSTKHGIVSKDDLKVTGGTLRVTAKGKGLAANDSIRIADGDCTVDAQDDSIHVDSSDDEAGYYYQCGGSLQLTSGDDGIHADGDTTVDAGKITITDCYEGIEGADVTINGGTISIVSQDDGINAAGGSDDTDTGSDSRAPDFFSASGDNTLTISGGEITIDADGDGVDSNGDFYMNGGTLYCSGQSADMNSAIDYGEGATAQVNGGILVATGYSGMAEAFSDDSAQHAALVGFSTVTDGTVTVTDADGEVIASWQPPKSYNCVYVSTPDMSDGETITVAAGDEKQTVTLDGIMTISNLQRGMGNGFMGGGPWQRR